MSALGTPLDGKGSLGDGASEPRSLESRAPSIMDRRSVHEPFATGVTAVDAMIPIGRGQGHVSQVRIHVLSGLTDQR